MELNFVQFSFGNYTRHFRTPQIEKINKKQRYLIENDVKKATNLKQQVWLRYKNKPTLTNFSELEKEKRTSQSYDTTKKPKFLKIKFFIAMKKPRVFHRTIKQLKNDCPEPKILKDSYPTLSKFNSFFVKIGQKLQSNANLIPIEAVTKVTTISNTFYVKPLEAQEFFIVLFLWSLNALRITVKIQTVS